MANKVEQVTQQYWRISLAFERRAEADVTITAGGASRELGQALTEVGPHRAITVKIAKLREHIICGGKPKCPTVKANISQLIPSTKP